MSNELDPHYLVALMSYIFADKQDGSSRRLDASSHTFEHGIVDNHETDVRTFPVLDAIANISVSRERHQVIAVALQLDPQKEEIRLIIAENQGVTKSLFDHLHKVWRNLQALSSEYAEHRGPDKPEYQLESPEMPMQVALNLKIQIFHDIYLYSLKQQIKRVNKWFRNLGRFVKVLLAQRGSSGLHGFEENLVDGVIALMAAQELVSKLHDDPQCQLTDEEWEKVYGQSVIANEEVRTVLADRHETGCEALAEELKDHYSGDPFNLRRALVKLTSLSQHIETLFGFAHSPRLRPALLYRMSIIGVGRRNRTVQLPPSKEEWKLFLKTACQRSYKWQEDESAKLSSKFGPRKYRCVVHCECKLIRHLETTNEDQWDNIPPFSYIGVSKLSCSACRIWIRSFNKLGGRQYYTRGSHGKWYWPWGMPKMEEKPLDKIMAKKVLKEYIAHEKASGRLRLESESTGASPRGAQHGLSDEQREKFAADTSAFQQEFGGDKGLLFNSKFPDV